MDAPCQAVQQPLPSMSARFRVAVGDAKGGIRAIMTTVMALCMAAPFKIFTPAVASPVPPARRLGASDRAELTPRTAFATPLADAQGSEAGAAAATSLSAGAPSLHCRGTDLVSLLQLEPRPLFELRYASPYNFLGTTLYAGLEPRLRCPVALALQRVQRDLAREGLGLKVWDAYRPLAVQQRMWDRIRDPRYVSDPAVNAGRHTRGTAVDVTLVDRLGRELPMPSDFDDFSAAAHRDAPGTPAVAAANARRLRQAMERHGFQSFATEWWHFDWRDWQELAPIRSAPASPAAAP